MGEKLVVTADFLASDYAPRICLFTGDTDHVACDPLRLMSGRPGYAPPTKRGVPAFDVWMAMPYTAAGRMWWSVERINRTAGTLCMAAALPAAMFTSWLEFLRPLSAHSIARIALLLLLGSLAVSWWTLRRQLVRVQVLKGATEVEIQFPRRLRTVYQAYRTAYELYVEEGSPAPGAKDPGEEWPEAITPGWDESGRTPAVKL